MNRVYDAETIAKFIIDYLYENGVPIANLKLQKILYYLQAHFLVYEGKELFPENIVAWKYGPVIPTIYSQFRWSGSRELEQSYTEVRDAIDEETAIKIKRVLEKSREYSPMELVRKSYNEEPFKNTQPNNNILKETIKSYYEENKNKLM